MNTPAPHSALPKRLPYLIAITGTVMALLLWYALISAPLAAPTLNLALHNVVLIAGMAIVILCTTITYLAQLLSERSATHSFIAQEASKELAERLVAEETKQKLEVALLQGQKLQAIGTLAGGIAHDFNNILYAIKGFVEMSREDIEKNTLVYNNLGRVLEAAQRGQDLVARILAFGQSRQVAVAPIPIQSVIEAVVALLKPTIPASVTLNLIGLTEDCLILGNQTQLHQVIVNIMMNAVDAMEGEGTITIKLNHIKANTTYLKPFLADNSIGYCKIEISDTGHGMDQSTMERIFEPFYTTKEVGKGTGLGLAIAHSIMKQHRGEITVSSQLGKGTLFTLLLPEIAESKQEVTHGQYSISGR